MAKAVFHKNQRVYVHTVGTWAQIEKVVPQWAKGVEEPIKITYEVGLGREFGSEELQAEETAAVADMDIDGGTWRLVRGKNKWMSQDECAHHPFPGTFPIVVTGDRDWGGWRVPGAEYDHDPNKIEYQARVIANSVKCVAVLRALVSYAEEAPENMSNAMTSIVQDGREVLRQIENG